MGSFELFIVPSGASVEVRRSTGLIIMLWSVLIIVVCIQYLGSSVAVLGNAKEAITMDLLKDLGLAHVPHVAEVSFWPYIIH